MIIEYDFGKKERVTPTRHAPADASPISRSADSSAFCVDKTRRQAAAEMPLERARARAAKLEAALRAAKAACETRRPTPSARILVDADEYARLLRCKQLVATALDS